MSDAAAVDYDVQDTTDDETETGTETQGAAESGSQGGVQPKIAPKKSETGEGEARDVGGVGGERLRSFVERIERLEEEKSHLMEDLKETYGEAKGVGFDVKTIRKIVSLRKMDGEKRRESEELLDLYKSAIGMF